MTDVPALQKPLIVGNWKMNAPDDLLTHLATFADVAQGRADVAICPPFPWLVEAARAAGEVLVGAQDCHWSTGGAHTGGVSASMIASLGARLVIVGHSERRADGDDDATVARKVAAVLNAGLQPILCVGENEQEANPEALQLQLRNSLPTHVGLRRIIIAYEPVWAIGSGRTPALRAIEQSNLCIHAELVRMLGYNSASAIPILYGGSVNRKNAAKISLADKVGGLLVGRASLDRIEFASIISACCT